MTRTVALLLLPMLAAAQGLDPKALRLFGPPADAWPTYNGDYSGRRYSVLDQINASSVASLAPAWTYRIEGVGPQRGVGNPVIKSTPLLVNDSVLHDSRSRIRGGCAQRCTAVALRL
jgi:alcohol dehydrogenase (cytochrome c)